MKHWTRAYHIAIISLLSGLLLGNFSYAFGLVGASTTTGGLVNGCAGVASSNTSLKLGGRVIQPETILRIPNGQPCASGEITLKLSSYTNTILLSANNVASTNGANLLAAMTAATPFDADHGVLIKLEPGLYDLGSTSLIMKPYVDLEGSGEDLTVIAGNVTTNGFPIDNGLISGASNSELRFITVDNRANGSIKASAIFVGSSITNFKITHVTAMASNGSGSGFEEAVESNGGTFLIQNSNLISNGTGSSGPGALAEFSSTIQILDSFLTGTTTGIFIYNPGGTVTVKNSTIKGGFSISSTTTTGAVNVGASQLIGSVNGTIFKCAVSYKSDFTATTASCT